MTSKSRNVSFQQKIFEDGILRCAHRQNIVADHQPMPTHHSAIYSSGAHLYTIDQLKQAVTSSHHKYIASHSNLLRMERVSISHSAVYSKLGFEECVAEEHLA